MVKVLAIMGSPRKGGSSDTLLNEFLRGVGEAGGDFEKICVGDFDISPCREILECERSGRCAIDDDAQLIFGKLVQADKIVVASPIFFYGLPAQLKALIDRSQLLWARKQVHKIRLEKSPLEAFALLVGATKGEKLFEGSLLTIGYFLKSFDTRLAGSLVYRGITGKADVEKHPTALTEAYQAGQIFARG